MQHPLTGERLERGPGNRASLFARDALAHLPPRNRHEMRTKREPQPATLPPMSAISNPPPADGTKTDLCIRKSSRRRGARPGFDLRIAELGARQYGLVALWQLPDLDEELARKRAKTGRLHRVHQGVYAIGHPILPRQGRFLAAVLAGGPGAVLSHRSAAVLHGLLSAMGNRIDVIAPNRRGRSPAGIAAHRDGTLSAKDRVEVGGVPCTSVARTLLDLAAAKDRGLPHAITQAEVERKFDLGEVVELLKRSKGRRGVARLRRAIEGHDPQEQEVRLELERRLLRLFKRAGFRPEVNGHLVVDGVSMLPDFLWRDGRLIVEADSRRVHDRVVSFEKDRRRDQLLAAAGWTVIRVTWRQLHDEPSRLNRTVKTILASSSRR
jgi:very-short-patch-repair endonuclease